jgi:3-oxoacyl-[acyl-carrier protein] reductase
MNTPHRTALVTGGARGIGAAIVRTLVGDGLAVAIVDRERSAARSLAAELEAGGHAVMAIEADIADPALARRSIDQTLEGWGRLDVLVNNAGVLRLGPLAELADESWQEVLAVNLTAPLVLSRHAAPHLAAGGAGSIVNITSIAADRGVAGAASYCASKGGLQSLTRALAVELAPAGVRVNAVAPHGIETDMTAAGHADPEIGGRVLAGIPLGRFGEPVDVAAAVSYLCADSARFVTGVTIPVQGGAAAGLL